MDHLDAQAGLLLLAALPPQAQRALRHSLRCERCRGQLVAAMAAAETSPSSSGTPDAADYEPMWGHLRARRELAADEYEAEQRQAADLLAELRPLAISDRLVRLESEPRFSTLALARSFLREAEQAVDPVAAFALARQARAVACRLSRKRYAHSVVAEVKAQAWCAEGDSRRRLGDGEGAERALDCAEKCLEGEPLDAPARANLCHRLALLLGERGQVDGALALLGRAAELWESLRDFGELGQVLAAQGSLYLKHEEPDSALPSFETAISLLESAQRPQAAVVAQFSLALAYLDVDRQEDALGALQHAVHLHHTLEGDANERDLRWLMAHVLERMGRVGEASATLGELVEDLVARGAFRDALLAGIELARCQTYHDPAAARASLRRAGGLAGRAKLPPQGRAAVDFVAHFALASGREDRRSLLAELVAYLVRSRYRPALPFGSGQRTHAEVLWEGVDLSHRALLCQEAGLPTALADPDARLDAHKRELLRLTAEEILRVRLTFQAES